MISYITIYNIQSSNHLLDFDKLFHFTFTSLEAIRALGDINILRQQRLLRPGWRNCTRFDDLILDIYIFTKCNLWYYIIYSYIDIYIYMIYCISYIIILWYMILYIYIDILIYCIFTFIILLVHSSIFLKTYIATMIHVKIFPENLIVLTYGIVLHLYVIWYSLFILILSYYHIVKCHNISFCETLSTWSSDDCMF